MTIYGLKGLIEALKKENKPSNKHLIEFYEDLYNEQLQQIADKVAKQLDQEQQSKKAWFEFLAK